MFRSKDVNDIDPIVAVSNGHVRKGDIEKAERCLIDNGIEADEVCTVLQALGYIMLDVELYPEPV